MGKGIYNLMLKVLEKLLKKKERKEKSQESDMIRSAFWEALSLASGQ